MVRAPMQEKPLLLALLLRRLLEAARKGSGELRSAEEEGEEGEEAGEEGEEGEDEDEEGEEPVILDGVEVQLGDCTDDDDEPM